MKSKNLIAFLLMSMTIIWAIGAYAIFEPSTVQEAYHKGAAAKIEFHVVDDAGYRVKDATVDVFFDMMDRSKGQRVIGETGSNGVFVAEAKTKGILERLRAKLNAPSRG